MAESNYDGIIRPGDLIHRVSVERQVMSPGVGQDLVTWESLGTFYARVKPLTGRELLMAQQVNALLTHSVLMRNKGGIGSLSVTPQDRLKWGSRVLNIESISEIGGYNEAYQIMCTEDV